MKKILSFMAVMLLWAVTANATLDSISAGTNQLRTAVGGSADTIVLKAGTYTEDANNYTVFSRDVVVMAASGADVTIQPISYFRIKTAANVQFKDIKFDGSEQGSYSYFIRFDDATATSLMVDGCEFENVKTPVFTHSDGGQHTDSLIINNSYFHNNKKQIIYFKSSADEEHQTCGKLAITNSTFANNDSLSGYESLIDVRTYNDAVTNDIKVLVDHCTFYFNPTKNSDHANIRTRGVSNVTVSNCIFAHPYEVDRCATYLPSGGNIKNCLAFNLTHNASDNYAHAWGATITGCMVADPRFENVANGFAVKYYSPTRGKATDGTDLGDPRWHTPLVLPSIDFATPHAFVSEDVTLDGNIELDANGYIHQTNNKTEWGTASWRFHATGACSLSATLNMSDATQSGHIYKVELFDADGNSKGFVQETGWDNCTTDKQLGGALIIPAAGDYKVVLYNLQEWSSSTIKGITLTEATYTVVGSNAALFGTTWNTENTDNDMVINAESGLLTWSKDLDLTAGTTIEFKVVRNHAWGTGEYPTSGNQSKTIDKNGLYRITVTYDGSNQLVMEAEDIAVYRTIYFKATAGYWNWDENSNKLATGAYAWGDGVPYVNAGWPGARMEEVEGEEGTWKIDLDSRYVNIIFTRINTSGDPVYKALKTADLVIPTDGNDMYTITRTSFDWSSDQLSAEDGEWGLFVPYVPTLANGYYLIGNINGADATWSIADLTADRMLEVNPSNEVEHMIETPLAEGDQLQVVRLYNDKITNWYPGGEGNNYYVDANHAGLQTIYFRSDTTNNPGGDGWHRKCIYVTANPDNVYARGALTVDKWGTICLPKAVATVENAGAEFYQVSNVNASVVNVVSVDALEAGKPYLFKATDTYLTVTMSGDAVADAIANGGLIGNLSSTPIALNAASNAYILSNNEFHLLIEDATASVKQYRAYLQVPAGGAPSQLRIVEAENNTTDVKSVEANEKAVKFFENGQLRILRDGVVYDATGRVVR